MLGPNLSLIAGLILAAFSVYTFVWTLFRKNSEKQVLLWAAGNEPTKSKSPLVEFSRPFVHQFTLKYATRIKRPQYRNKVQRKIMTSGLGSEINVDEFIGLQLLWGILFPAILLIMNFALELDYPFIFIFAFGLLGFYVPFIYCNQQIKLRYNSVVVDLPFFIDLLALSTEAGLDFISAIQRITEKAEKSVLADELINVLRDIRLGSSRADALKALAQRLDMAEVTSFVNVIVDADATGASISRVLKDQSEQIRMERFVRAEKAGAKASQTILIPLMVFILPAVFIMVFAPVALQFMYEGK